MENKNKITYPLSLKDRVDYINEIEKIVLDVLVDEISNLFSSVYLYNRIILYRLMIMS